MLNNVIIMGRIGNDIELRKTGGGTSVVTFPVACDRDFKTDGEKVTDWLDVVAWRNTAEYLAKYGSKGRMVVIKGSVQTRSWTDKDGNKRKAVEIVTDNVYFADSKNTAHGNLIAGYEETYSDVGFSDVDANDLPF